jgi:hypothetical protein
MGTKMADQQNDEKNKKESAPAAPNVPPKTVHEVVVKHLDEPPPSGKPSIHPRRPAPIVPTREERTGEQPDEDTDSKKPASE